MDVESKLAVMKSFAEEIVTEDELRTLFETNDHPIAYDGFEPSGIAPIHFGLLRARNVKKMLADRDKDEAIPCGLLRIHKQQAGGGPGKDKDGGRILRRGLEAPAE